MITGKALGYRTFLNPIGLQIILVGDGIQSRTIEKEIFVDKVQTFTVLIQNVFLVDTQEKIVEKSETWGQFKVGKYRNAIEKCLKAHVS
ncbi:MAG TPA: hypothetical protein ENJ82_06880 [Bacteroidetes bacterium]|nr:hypothetical protein [Bacteroidota bacterium]